MEPRTILIVEDDGETRRIISQGLGGLGHRVLEADGVKVGLHLFRVHLPDLVVLDLNLPDGSGLDACAQIRAHRERSATPVIILTGEEHLATKSQAFTAGADQYLVKPLHLTEFLLWVGALLRRLDAKSTGAGSLHVGDLLIDPEARLARFRGTALADLTIREFDLLYGLVRNRPKPLSRRYILSSLWRTVAVDNLVDTHLRNLRRKLPVELADRIQSVPGIGFRFLD